MDKKELDEIIVEELNSYDKYLNQCVVDNSEFAYLGHVAEKYGLSGEEVIDRGLDVFNWYMRNGVDEFQSKVMSLYLTHEYVLRRCLK